MESKFTFINSLGFDTYDNDFETVESAGLALLWCILCGIFSIPCFYCYSLFDYEGDEAMFSLSLGILFILIALVLLIRMISANVSNFHPTTHIFEIEGIKIAVQFYRGEIYYYNNDVPNFFDYCNRAFYGNGPIFKLIERGEKLNDISYCKEILNKMYFNDENFREFINFPDKNIVKNKEMWDKRYSGESFEIYNNGTLKMFLKFFDTSEILERVRQHYNADIKFTITSGDEEVSYNSKMKTLTITNGKSIFDEDYAEKKFSMEESNSRLYAKIENWYRNH